MKRTDALNHNNNRFKDRDVGAGTDGTVLDETWLNNVQEELAAIIETNGGTLDGGVENQIATLLNGMFSARAKYSEMQADWVMSGLAASAVGLDVTVTPGSAFYNGNLITVGASEPTLSFSVAINKASYVCLKPDGTLDVIAIASASTTGVVLTGLPLFLILSGGTQVDLIYNLVGSKVWRENKPYYYAESPTGFLTVGTGIQLDFITYLSYASAYQSGGFQIVAQGDGFLGVRVPPGISAVKVTAHVILSNAVAAYNYELAVYLNTVLAKKAKAKSIGPNDILLVAPYITVDQDSSLSFHLWHDQGGNLTTDITRCFVMIEAVK